MPSRRRAHDQKPERLLRGQLQPTGKCVRAGISARASTALQGKQKEALVGRGREESPVKEGRSVIRRISSHHLDSSFS